MSQLRFIFWFSSCLLLNIVIVIKATKLTQLVLIWIVFSCLFTWYQKTFVLMGMIRRPEKHYEILAVLAVLDVAAPAAVAIFCGLGWLGIPLVVATWFAWGGLTRVLAERHALRDILRIINEHEPQLPFEQKRNIASTMLGLRWREYQERR